MKKVVIIEEVLRAAVLVDAGTDDEARDKVLDIYQNIIGMLESDKHFAEYSVSKVMDADKCAGDAIDFDATEGTEVPWGEAGIWYPSLQKVV